MSEQQSQQFAADEVVKPQMQVDVEPSKAQETSPAAADETAAAATSEKKKNAILDPIVAAIKLIFLCYSKPNTEKDETKPVQETKAAAAAETKLEPIVEAQTEQQQQPPIIQVQPAVAATIAADVPAAAAPAVALTQQTSAL